MKYLIFPKNIIMNYVLRNILVLLFGILFTLSCSSQKNEPILLGPYNARIATVSEDQQIQALNQTSEIKFTFNEDGSLLYEVAAMGKSNSDIGKSEIRGDSLYFFDMQRGPNTAFHLEKIDEGVFRISGPNQFVLTSVKE
jgi:hypothetical protein